MITLEQHLAAHAARRWDDGSENLECLCGWIVDYEEIDFGINATTPDVLVQEDAQHASHVAATWREARTVRTAEELDALHRDTQVAWINPDGTLRCTTHADHGLLPDIIATSRLTLRVLWTPEDGVR